MKAEVKVQTLKKSGSNVQIAMQLLRVGFWVIGAKSEFGWKNIWPVHSWGS